MEAIINHTVSILIVANLMFCHIPTGTKAGPQSHPKSETTTCIHIEHENCQLQYIYIYTSVLLLEKEHRLSLPDCGFLMKFLMAFEKY